MQDRTTRTITIGIAEHAAVDTRVRNTFAADSKAQSKNKLYDPYVKAFRWAMDKLGDEGNRRVRDEQQFY